MARKPESPDHYFSSRPKSKLSLGILQVTLRGIRFEFLTASGVFSRKRLDLGTRLLVDSMILPEEGCVLDIGCGYGAVGIAAATFNPNLRVMMVDVNERAVWLTKQNIEINRVRNVEARRGHLYEPVKDASFDCVLSNPPVSAGMETVKAIIAGAPERMAKKAPFQMVVKSKIGGKRLQEIFKDSFGNVAVLSRESGYRVLIARNSKSSLSQLEE